MREKSQIQWGSRVWKVSKKWPLKLALSRVCRFMFPRKRWRVLHSLPRNTFLYVFHHIAFLTKGRVRHASGNVGTPVWKPIWSMKPQTQTIDKKRGHKNDPKKADTISGIGIWRWQKMTPFLVRVCRCTGRIFGKKSEQPDSQQPEETMKRQTRPICILGVDIKWGKNDRY